MDFNVMEYKKLTGMVSAAMLQTTFKKLLFVDLCCNIKAEHTQ